MQLAMSERKARRWEIVAASLLGLAILLQIPGYAGTCTGGDSDELFVGGMLSVFPSLMALGLIARETLNASSRTRIGIGAALITILLLATFMCFTAASMTFNTLIRFGAACGHEFNALTNADNFYRPIWSLGFVKDDVFIGIVYGVIPFLCLASASTLAWRRRFGRSVVADV
jgi:hypothetical protein